MSGDFPFSVKTVSPVKCNEKPWDLWVSEIGHSSPQRDDNGVGIFVSPEVLDTKGGISRRISDTHPYKLTDRNYARHRRKGVNRLRYDTMHLHGLFPQMDNLNAAICHMCGMTLKCSAAYRHLVDSHAAGVEPILPPPPPTVKLKSSHNRSRHKKEPPPPPSTDLPVSMETSPVHTANPNSLSRLVIPQSDLQYLDEASTSSAVSGEVQVCVESGELPVVSIQDTEDLALGENITDDIFAIMNSEGIQSADDITNVTDWKNIIRDIGSMQDINFSNTTDTGQQQEVFPSTDPALSSYTLTEADLSSLQFAPNSSPMLSTVLDGNMLNAQPLKPPVPVTTTTTPTTKSHSRSKTSKAKHSVREYDPNKHCGVVTADNPKPCTRSLTCKAHALSLRRTVEGRCKPFDTLLAEHRASKDPTLAAVAPPPPPTNPVSVPIPPSVLVNNIDLSAFNSLTAEQQVNDIYASLLSVEDPNAVLPDTSSITSLLSQPPDQLFLPEDADLESEVPLLSITSPVSTIPAKNALPTKVEEKIDEGPPTFIPGEVCWYASCPRPLALCTFNTSHAGNAITLSKKCATVRNNMKSSYSRSQCKSSASGVNYYNFNQNSLSLSKSVHMNNASKASKPEVRKLIVTCSGRSSVKGISQTLGDLGYLPSHTTNGHLVSRDEDRRRQHGALKTSKRATAPSMLDLNFVLDPLLADEKC